jgi:hypothetical protein
MNQNEAVNTNRENTQSRPTVDSSPPVSAATHAGRRPGPQTADAKAKVRHNAVRHGLCTIVPVIPRLERAADWEAHRTGVLESLQPVGYLETLWAERVILEFWRLRRLAAYELAQITEEHVVRQTQSTRRDGQNCAVRSAPRSAALPGHARARSPAEATAR